MAIKDLLIKIGIRGDKKAQGALRKTEGSMKSLGSAALKVGAVFFAARGLVRGFSTIIKLAGEQQKAEAKLNAVLKSTAGVAGLTAKELKNMASELQGVTTFGDETIIGAQSLLLTFTKIGEEVFPQATETILNMSAAMGTDLQSSTVQLGKALNDPITGISALSRVGVQLTDSQKEQIKSFTELGDIASAQKVILGELETQFGGLARATAQTMMGSLEQLGNAFGDVGETIGEILSPAITQGANKMKELTESFNISLSALKKIDFKATGENILKNTEALLTAFTATFRAYIDYIPDYWKSLFGRILPIMRSVLEKIINANKVMAQFIWEPIIIKAQIMAIKVKNLFIEMFNVMKEQFNKMADTWAGEKLGMEIMKPTDLIDIEGLKAELGETGMSKLLSKLFTGEDNIQSLSDFTANTSAIWSDYFKTVAVLAEESSKKTATAVGAVGDATDETTDSVKKMTIEQAISAGQGAESMIGAARRIIKAYLAEGVAGQIKDVLTKVPPPYSLVLAGVAAAAAAQLFDKLIPKFAEGGIVPGMGRQDSVPAMLTPGEVVLNQAQQENLAGGMGLTVNIQGGVIDESYVTNELIPALNKATSLGTPLNA